MTTFLKIIHVSTMALATTMLPPVATCVRMITGLVGFLVLLLLSVIRAPPPVIIGTATGTAPASWGTATTDATGTGSARAATASASSTVKRRVPGAAWAASVGFI